MTERDAGADLNGLVEYSGKFVEPASDLDGTVDTEYTPKTQEELDKQEIEDYLGPETFLEKIGQSKSFKKAGSIVVAATTTFGVGAAAAEAVSPSDTELKPETEIVSEFQGEISSKTALDKMMAKASAGASDVTPAAQPTPLGPEATPSLLDLVTPEYKKITLEAINDISVPLPVDRMKNELEVWRIEKYESNKEFFRNLGQKDEYWLEEGARGLDAYDNAEKMTSGAGIFAEIFPREKFIEAIVNSQSEYFLCDEDGHPGPLLVGFNDRMLNKGLYPGIELLEKGGVIDFHKSLRDSGTCILLAAELRVGAGAGAGLYNQWGLLNLNMSEDNIKKIKDKKFPLFFATNLPPESTGISFTQITLALDLYSGFEANNPGLPNAEVVKNLIGGMIISNVDTLSSVFGEDLLGQAEYWAGNYGLSTNDNWIKRQRDIVLEVYNVVGENVLVTTEK